MRNKKWRLFGALATAVAPLAFAVNSNANAPNPASNVQSLGISQTTDGTTASPNNGAAIADIAFPPATTGGALVGANLATVIDTGTTPQTTAAVIGTGVNNAINKSQQAAKNNPGVVTATKEVNDLILPNGTTTTTAASNANGNPNTFGAPSGANWLATPGHIGNTTTT